MIKPSPGWHFCFSYSIPQRSVSQWQPVPWFNIMMPSYQYRKSHCGDKTILRPSYLHNGISYTAKMTSLYWIRAPVFSLPRCCFISKLSFKTIPFQSVLFYYDIFAVAGNGLSLFWYHCVISVSSWQLNSLPPKRKYHILKYIISKTLFSKQINGPKNAQIEASGDHFPRDKMDAVSQTIFSEAFSWIKRFVFWLKSHWSLFLRVQLTIIQHWFK